MARQPVVRHDPPDLSALVRPDAGIGRRDRGRRRGDAAQDEVRGQEFRRRDEPVQFRADQPAGPQADDRNPRREPAQGPRQHAQGHRRRADDPEQAGRVRGRQEPRDDAGQGHPRDAALPADPVHADHRHGAGNAAGGVPAVDQPLLHPRPQPGEKLRQMVRRPGRIAVHGQLEVGRREHRRRGPRRLCAERPDRRDRHHPRVARRRERPRHRLLRRRHHARRDARLSSPPRARRPRSSRRPSSPPRSISPKPAT